MKPIRREFTTVATHYIPIDTYADRGVSFNVVSGAATVDTTITNFNAGLTINVLEAGVTAPVDYAISGLIINVTVEPCVVEVMQHGT